MSNDPNHPDRLERAMLELHAAEEAGVFQPTRLDAERLLRPAEVRVLWPFLWSRRGLAVAAGLALAFGVWGSMFAYKIGHLRDMRVMPVVTAGAGAAGCDDCNFFGCLAGPAVRIAAACSTHDYDLDGDVDLADFRQYQLAHLGSGRVQ